MLDSRSRGCRFKPHRWRSQYVVSLSKTHYQLLSIGSTQEGLKNCWLGCKESTQATNHLLVDNGLCPCYFHIAYSVLFLPFTTNVVCSHICLCTFVALTASTVNPDQTAPLGAVRSGSIVFVSMIKVFCSSFLD